MSGFVVPPLWYRIVQTHLETWLEFANGEEGELYGGAKVFLMRDLTADSGHDSRRYIPNVAFDFIYLVVINKCASAKIGPASYWVSQLTNGEKMENLTNAEMKLTIAKLIELAYSQDKGMTTKIILEKGMFKLTVDEGGNAVLTGKAGFVRFVGTPAFDKVGASLKWLSVTFSGGEDNRVRYIANVNLKIASLAVSGDFNVVDLITSCSGLLCQAARFLQKRNEVVDSEMQRIMGY